MKTLGFVKAHNLSRLHDELLAQIPALRPRPNPQGVVSPTTSQVMMEPVMGVQGRGNDIWLTVPDGTDEPMVAAVVQAHDPTTLPPPTRRQVLEAKIGNGTILFSELIELLRLERRA